MNTLIPQWLLVEYNNTAALSHVFVYSMQLTGVAKHTDGTLAEAEIPLTVTILDMNDNAPHFELYSGNVSEASKEGTAAMSTPSQPVVVTKQSC